MAINLGQNLDKKYDTTSPAKKSTEQPETKEQSGVDCIVIVMKEESEGMPKYTNWVAFVWKTLLYTGLVVWGMVLNELLRKGFVQ